MCIRDRYQRRVRGPSHTAMEELPERTATAFKQIPEATAQATTKAVKAVKDFFWSSDDPTDSGGLTLSETQSQTKALHQETSQLRVKQQALEAKVAELRRQHQGEPIWRQVAEQYTPVEIPACPNPELRSLHTALCSLVNTYELDPRFPEVPELVSAASRSADPQEVLRQVARLEEDCSRHEAVAVHAS
eukprot:TRINITY_DN12710_c0_g1_i1.p1 TRINITY_DN12710_c0_g1~~TRINITY_DN12710_c0_g1_i1.p1  ORF type:complete len:189 (+),score=46.55 TRINITY_DN12710_c0_g1_i1:127-693(+)